MRITNNILVNNLRNNLSRNIRTLEQIQHQLETGRKINKPSDNPTGMVESLRYASRLRENAQFQENVQDALGWLNTTDDALGSLNTALQRIYELTLEAASGTMDASERLINNAEVEQLLIEMESIANMSHGDHYIFGGTNTTEAPYANGTWQANDRAIRFEVGAGVEITVNLTAREVFRYPGEGDGAGSGPGIMETVQEIVTHLRENNGQALGQEDVAQLLVMIDHVLACRAQVGASVNRLEMTETRLKEQEISFAKLQADVDGVDTAWAIMELKEQEGIYRASLAVGARVIMPTLVDFIR